MPKLSTTLAGALLALLLAACTSPPQAPAAPPSIYWRLANESSDLRFVTTKNTNVAEVQQFTHLSGDVTPQGTVKLVIDLASVETRIPIRNERMQSMLFEIANFPTAEFDGSLDMKQVNALLPGASVDIDVAGRLTLHGQTQDAAAMLRVVRLTGDRLLVVTRAPILVTASKYELGPGIDKLREIAGLNNIVGTVPVTFSLVFQK